MDAKPAFGDLTMRSADVIETQRKANDAALDARDAAKIENVTVSSLATEVGESLRGILQDATSGKSAGEIFTTGNRLRGLGVFLTLVAALLLVIARS
jgi:hypothetical protein